MVSIGLSTLVVGPWLQLGRGCSWGTSGHFGIKRAMLLPASRAALTATGSPAGLSAEQQTFIVLADTVLKQLDSFKNADGGVGGPVRRYGKQLGLCGAVRCAIRMRGPTLMVMICVQLTAQQMMVHGL